VPSDDFAARAVSAADYGIVSFLGGMYQFGYVLRVVGVVCVHGYYVAGWIGKGKNWGDLLCLAFKSF